MRLGRVLAMGDHQRGECVAAHQPHAESDYPDGDQRDGSCGETDAQPDAPWHEPLHAEVGTR